MHDRASREENLQQHDYSLRGSQNTITHYKGRLSLYAYMGRGISRAYNSSKGCPMSLRMHDFHNRCNSKLNGKLLQF
jgi:hypothetical protein